MFRLCSFVIACLLLAACATPAEQQTATPALSLAQTQTAVAKPTTRPRDTATPDPTATPIPQPVEVDFTTIYSQKKGVPIIIVGRFRLPASTTCGEECFVYLQNPAKATQSFGIYLHVGRKTDAQPLNTMASLPSPYGEADFRVRMDNGEYAGVNSLVRITGVICPKSLTNPMICDVSKIEPGK